MLLTQLKADTH